MTELSVVSMEAQSKWLTTMSLKRTLARQESQRMTVERLNKVGWMKKGGERTKLVEDRAQQTQSATVPSLPASSLPKGCQGLSLLGVLASSLQRPRTHTSSNRIQIANRRLIHPAFAAFHLRILGWIQRNNTAIVQLAEHLRCYKKQSGRSTHEKRNI